MGKFVFSRWLVVEMLLSIEVYSIAFFLHLLIKLQIYHEVALV